jgi:adenylyltransferase/sulfurtransferase
MIEGVGEEGQRKLKQAKVIVAGVGGLGCPAAIYLAVAGIGRLILIDKEKVELSNLNRQVLHGEKDIGRYKVDSAVEKLRQLNPDIVIEGLKVNITRQNVSSLIKDADLVVDGMDNFRTRFLLNEACVRYGKPFIHAAVYGLTGELMTIIPGEGPCYQCYITTEPPEVKPFPVLGATPGVLACLEAMEAIKLITGIGEPLVGKLLLFDGLKMTFQTLNINRLSSCPVCSGNT